VRNDVQALRELPIEAPDGLITSTALNLFLMPALYARFGKGRPAPL
jgi:Cu/Ag efflux pump CusA